MRQGGVAEQDCGGKMKPSRLSFGCVVYWGVLALLWAVLQCCFSLSKLILCFPLPLSFHSQLHKSHDSLTVSHCACKLTLIYKLVTQEHLHGVSLFYFAFLNLFVVCVVVLKNYINIVIHININSCCCYYYLINVVVIIYYLLFIIIIYYYYYLILFSRDAPIAFFLANSKLLLLFLFYFFCKCDLLIPILFLKTIIDSIYKQKSILFFFLIKTKLFT